MSTPFTSARHNNTLNVTTGYRRAIAVTLSRAGQQVDIEPVDASFTQDARRGMRWDGSIAIADEALLPQTPFDLLAPFGTRAFVRLGLTLSDDSVAYVPYGVYIVSSTRTRTNASNRITDLTLTDLGDVVDKYRFEEPLTIASGTDLAQVVNIVVTSRTGVNPAIANVNRQLGADRTLGLDPETGPWAELLDILQGFGLTAWYNRLGIIEIGSNVVNTDNAAPQDQLIDISADFDTRPPNVMVVRGEPLEEDAVPVQAVAMDTNPVSPTYAGEGPGLSPYGRVTRFFSSHLIETEAQAAQVAADMLAKYVGAGAAWTATRPYDPTRDANDVVSVDGRVVVVDAITIDMQGLTTFNLRQV